MDIALIILVSSLLLINIILLIKSFSYKDSNLKGELDKVLDKIVTTFNTANQYIVDRIEKDNKNRQEEIGKFVASNQEHFKEMRKELAESIDSLQIKVNNSLRETREDNVKALDKIREENNKKLDEIRGVVDEKLQEGLEKRFNEKFKLIGERLDSVNKGLGEMSVLGDSVKDIQMVFSNVKTRGNWGEKNLESLLDETIPGQFYTQYRFANKDIVDFAIKIPISNGTVLLPLDSKFPMVSFTALVDANLAQDQEEIVKKQREFARTIKNIAKDIKKKYVLPPLTTDYAVMYLPSESIYAEVMRDISILEELNQANIMPAGPNSMLGLLNTLKMGFRSIAIQESAREVIHNFKEIKKMLSDYGTFIDKAKRNIRLAGDNIEEISKQNITITNRLGEIEAMQVEDNADEVAVLEVASDITLT